MACGEHTEYWTVCETAHPNHVKVEPGHPLPIIQKRPETGSNASPSSPLKDVKLERKLGISEYGVELSGDGNLAVNKSEDNNIATDNIYQESEDVSSTDADPALVSVKEEPTDDSLSENKELVSSLLISSSFTCVVCNATVDEADAVSHMSSHNFATFSQNGTSGEHFSQVDNGNRPDEQRKGFSSANPVAVQLSSQDLLYTCEKCNIAFLGESILTEHLEKHTESVTTTDSEKTLEETGLLKPKTIQLTGCKVLHQCIVCLLTFLTESSLKQHIMTEHSKKAYDYFIGLEQCSTLGKIDVLESTQFLLQCSVCKLALGGTSWFEKHMEDHHDTKSCVLCGLTFASSEEMKKHKKAHPETWHECSDCGKRFQRQHALTVHRRTHTGERPYKCSKCEKSFMTRGNLTVHERRHEDAAGHKCKICDLKFSSERGLKQHMKYHSKSPAPSTDELPKHINSHQQKRAHLCNICGKSYQRAHDLTVHLRSHTDSRPFACIHCSKAFRVRGHLTAHLRTHSDYSGFKCQECRLRFPSVNGLQKHVMLQHIEDNTRKAFKCDQCDASFRRKEALVAHERSHQGLKPYQCRHCDKSFMSMQGRLAHEKIHSGLKKYSCEHCHKVFSRISLRKRHEETHLTGQNIFLCKFCDKGFSTKQGIDNHEKMHRDELPFMCSECGKKFPGKNALQRHQLCHSEEKEYLCHYCGKLFSYATALRTHLRMHTGEKPFVCEHCDKSFTFQSTFLCHQRLHTGERPYSCSHCFKSFVQSAHYKLHMKIHHMHPPGVDISSTKMDGKKQKRPNFVTDRLAGKKRFKSHEDVTSASPETPGSASDAE